VQVSEPGDEREPDSGSSRARGRGAAVEDVEDGPAVRFGDARAAVLDRDEDAPVVALDAYEDLGTGPRVLDGVREQVLDDALDLRRVDFGHDGFGPYVDLVPVGLVLGDDLRGQLSDIGGAEDRPDEAEAKPVEIE
jgi:hypothetical protein